MIWLQFNFANGEKVKLKYPMLPTAPILKFKNSYFVYTKLNKDGYMDCFEIFTEEVIE